MSNDEAQHIVSEDESVWILVHKRLSTMVNDSLNQTGRGFFDGLLRRIGLDLHQRLDTSLRHVGYGHRIDNVNETVHHEVEVAVDGALHDFNVTSVNGTFQHALVAKLDQEIELEAISKVINNMTGNVNQRDQDFFHSMPVKDETLFVALVSMGIIVPIIIFTLCGVYFYKKKKEKEVRREEMLLRDSSQFTIEFSSEDRDPGEHKGNAGEDVADLDFRQDYQA